MIGNLNSSTGRFRLAGRGETDAPAVLEYGDYECPYSRQAFRAIERVERPLSGRVRFALHRGGYDTGTLLEALAR